MIVASGVVEIKGSRNLNETVSELKSRGLVIDDVDGEKVSFQIERNTIGEVRDEMNFLRQLEVVSNLHITYYSLEDMGNNQEFKDK